MQESFGKKLPCTNNFAPKPQRPRWGEPMENVGEGIHVYFRKYDDCPTASALWKAIEAEPHWAVAVAFAVQEARAAPKATTNTEQKVE